MSHVEKAPRVILAPNPSPLTGTGTNTFLIGRKRLAVIDPGPDLPGHIDAIMEAADGAEITHIFVTHAHLDHSPGARLLARRTGAPVLAFGPPDAGRSRAMQRLLDQGYQSKGEGIDHDFRPDITLADGEQIATPEWELTAIHTPGHFGNHLSFWDGEQVYTGDLIMGWSTTLISPPDGDLADFYRSLQRVNDLGASRLIPAHGDPVLSPAARIRELAAHREERSAQILAQLHQRPGSAAELAARIYNISPALMPAATRNVLAHLIAFREEELAGIDGIIDDNSVFYKK